MNKLIRAALPLFTMALIGGGAITAVIPQTAMAYDEGCNSNFLGIPAWYNGLSKKVGDKCEIMSPSELSKGAEDGGLTTFVWVIVLNILSIVMSVAAYIAVGFILYGGFLLMTSRGKPADIAEGQITIRNAVIGLAISFGAVPVVRYLTDVVGGAAVSGLPTNDANQMLADVLGIVYWVGGVIAVITIIIAGYTYTISGGNPGEVEKSKNTILYAVIGLIVIIGAFTITHFVIGRF